MFSLSNPVHALGGAEAAGAALAASGAEEELAAAEAPAFGALALVRATRMVKLATRRWSRALKATVPAVISTSSGFVNQGQLLAKLRSNSDTRSLD